MSAPMGKHALEESENVTSKRLKSESDDVKLRSFLDWCKDGNLELSSKVQVGEDGSCAQYGMVATEDVAEGEILFTIPRALLLTPETSAIADLLDQESSSLQSASGWVPLLVSLLHEYTSPTSQWRPYMDLVPDFDQLDLPMFWQSEIVEQELQGTGVEKSAGRDEENISNEFNNVVLPFLKNYPLHFPEECLDIQLYKKMVAFVMAYSFTEPVKVDGDEEGEEDGEPPKSPPLMVPMADILNHIAKNNAHLDFGEESLKMVAVKKIAKGEEVYNTYGELSNMHLLHMYGFAEEYPNNHYDIVEIQHTTIEKCLRSQLNGNATKQAEFNEKWTYLQTVGAITPSDGACVVGLEGILTEPEMILTLKVLNMNLGHFREYARTTDGWESEEEGDEESLLYEDFRKLPPSWKDTLGLVARECLSNYPRSLAEEEACIEGENWAKLTPRQQYCCNVRYGQMKLLQQLLENCIGAACIRE